MAKAGLDRKAIRDYVANTEHTTILGKIKFVGSENVGTPGSVSQWQKGEFEVVWPKADRHRAAAGAEAALGLTPRDDVSAPGSSSSPPA